MEMSIKRVIISSALDGCDITEIDGDCFEPGYLSDIVKFFEYYGENIYEYELEMIRGSFDDELSKEELEETLSEVLEDRYRITIVY